MSTRQAVIALVIVGGVGAGIWAALPQHGATGRSYANLIRIGAVLADPPSSDGATSSAVREGFSLAQADLNAEWKDDPHVELVIVDSGGSASGASERLRELKKAGVQLVAEVVGSSTLAGCVAAVRDEKLLVLTATAYDPSLTSGLGQHFFRVTPNEGYLARELVREARLLGCQKPALVCPDGPEGELLANAFQQACVGTGLDRIFRVVPGQVGPQKIVDKLLKTAPDAVLLLVSSQDAAEVAAGFQAEPSSVRVLGTSRSLDPEALRKAGAAALLGSPRLLFLAMPDQTVLPRRVAVEAAWRHEFGGKPGASQDPRPEVFAAFDALEVLARAARDMNSDVERTSAQLRTRDFDGATGRVCFDENGERRAPPLLRRTFTDKGVSIPFEIDQSKPALR